MKTISLTATFDGHHIRLDEPFDLMPNTRLLVTVLPDGDPDFGASGLRQASLIRLGFPNAIPDASIAGVLGRIAKTSATGWKNSG